MWQLFYLFVIALSLCTATGQVQIGILRGSESILRYRDGCSWRTTGLDFLGEQVTLRGVENSESFPVKCEVGNQLLLDALVRVYYDSDDIPSPTNVSLDDNVLQWSHVLQPPDLPPAFELVHEFTLSYLVHMTDRDDVEAARSVAVNETSLNIEDMLDTCRRQYFTVQAVIDNETLSENSSPVSGQLDCSTVPSPSTSVVISSSTSTVIDAIRTSLPTPTESTTASSNNNPKVIIVFSIGTAVIIMILAGIIALSLFLTVYKCRAPKTSAVAEDLPLQRNEAYSTVVPLKRNEAYDIVQRTGLGANNVDSHTSHDYETVQ